VSGQLLRKHLENGNRLEMIKEIHFHIRSGALFGLYTLRGFQGQFRRVQADGVGTLWFAALSRLIVELI